MNGSKPLSLLRRRGIQTAFPSPSPRPSPSGRGRRGSGVEIVLRRCDFVQDWMTVPLSLRERARVRGNDACDYRARRTIPQTVETYGSSGTRGGLRNGQS